MKVVLITPTPPDISAFGVRSLSAYLRDNGYDVKLIFLPGSIGLLREGGGFAYHYEKAVLDQILDLCKDADIIGISFMTNYFDRAIQITEKIKRGLDIPVIWGGIHASTKPEEALEHADMVCIGEGEEALLELVDTMKKHQPVYSVKGIWFRKNGRIIKNPLRPLITELDHLAPYDFSNDRHYLLNKQSGRIEPLTDELFKNTMPLLPGFEGGLKHTYRTMTDRGCPHMCAYCNVPTLKRLYKDDKSPYLRARSVGHVIEELVRIRKRYPFVQAIQIFDDTFFARSLKYIECFSQLYKEQVGLPLYCQTSPDTLSKDKLKILLCAGLVYVEMGIQTGSKRIRALYRRKETNEKILQATNLLHSHLDKLIPPDYHVIIDNPWETQEDTLETVKLLYQIPKPYGLAIASLVFFPKTELYEKAIQQGIIKDEMTDIYRKPFYLPPKKTYVNFLIYLLTFQHLPKSIIAFLMRDKTVKRLSGMNLSFVYKMSYVLAESFRFLGKGLTAISQGDWERISLFFRKLTIRDPVVAGRKK